MTDCEEDAASSQMLDVVVACAQIKVGRGRKRTVHGHPKAGDIFIRESAVSEAAISGDSFHFVNFDWAGGEGIARYPVLLDNDITDLQPVSFIMSGDWPPGVVPCGIITPALDEDIMTTSIHELMGQGPRFCWTDAIL